MHMNFKTLVLSLSLLGTTAATHVHAQDASQTARFSDRGRTLLAGSVSGHWSSRDYGADAWQVSLQPSLAHFVADRIAVGLMPGYSTGESETALSSRRFHEASLAVYGIYDLPLAEKLSLLLIPTLGYSYRKQEQAAPEITLQGAPPSNLTTLSVPPDTRHTLRVTVHLPFVYHASSSVVLGIGPYFLYDRMLGAVAYSSSSELEAYVAYSPFSPDRNRVHVGLSSFIGASF
jgi:hypothetical protein